MPLASIKDKINAIRRGTGIGSKDDLAALEKAQKLWQDMYDVATARQNEKVIEKEKGEIDQVAEEQKDSPDPKPIGRGVFGSIYDQFKGKAKEAINFLLRKKEGNAVAALHHKDVGDIDLCYGNDKAGLKKIAEKHPEVLDNLQGVIDGMEVVRASDNRVILESSTHKAVVSKMLGDKKTDNWLLSAYEKKGISASSSDIETEPQGKRNGTAAPQNYLSESKDTDSSSNPQEKNGENDADAHLSVRNSGYTTRDDGTSLSNRAKDAEDEGSFTAGRFKSRYKVSGEAFDALEKLGVVEKSEWHHTGKRFKESDFFSWKDSDHIGGDTDYGSGEQAGLHARYMENKKEIDRLAADFKKRSWEYEDEEPVREMSYDQFCGERYRRLPVLSREEYLTEDQKREKERLHAEISGNERGLSSYGRYLEHRDVDERYDGLAFENYKKAEEETLRPEYAELAGAIGWLAWKTGVCEIQRRRHTTRSCRRDRGWTTAAEPYWRPEKSSSFYRRRPAKRKNGRCQHDGIPEDSRECETGRNHLVCDRIYWCSKCEQSRRGYPGEQQEWCLASDVGKLS